MFAETDSDIPSWLPNPDPGEEEAHRPDRASRVRLASSPPRKPVPASESLRAPRVSQTHPSCSSQIPCGGGLPAEPLEPPRCSKSRGRLQPGPEAAAPPPPLPVSSPCPKPKSIAHVIFNRGSLPVFSLSGPAPSSRQSLAASGRKEEQQGSRAQHGACPCFAQVTWWHSSGLCLGIQPLESMPALDLEC